MKNIVFRILIILISTVLQFSCSKETNYSNTEILDLLTQEKFEYVCMITNSDTNYNSYKNALKIREYTQHLSSRHKNISNEFKNSYNSLVDLYIDKTKSELCKLKKHENNRVYQYKLTEYLILSSIAEKINGTNFLFDNIRVQITSNAAYNGGKLKFGEEYLGHVVIVVKPDSMRVSLNDGREEMIRDYYYEIKSPCNEVGKKEIKGTVDFPIGKNREIRLNFNDTYVVQ